MIKFGIMGATGYMGGEALRILLDHPQAEIAGLTSRSEERIDDHHPNLYGLGLKMIPPDRVTPCDVVFLALPTGASIEAAEQLTKQGAKVIDLGAAFRLRDRALWESVYAQAHPQWHLARDAPPGWRQRDG